MPDRPKRFGCDRPPRLNAAARGYCSAKWRRFRAAKLADDPVCQSGGCPEPATDVDHIREVNGPNDPLFFERANVQSLCHSCHSKKTRRSQGLKGGGA